MNKTVVIKGAETDPIATPDPVGIKKIHQIRWKNDLKVPVWVVFDSKAREHLEPDRVEIPENGSGNEKVKMKDRAKKGRYKYSIELTTKDGERVVKDPYIDVEEDG